MERMYSDDELLRMRQEAEKNARATAARASAPVQTERNYETENEPHSTAAGAPETVLRLGSRPLKKEKLRRPSLISSISGETVLLVAILVLLMKDGCKDEVLLLALLALVVMG